MLARLMAFVVWGLLACSGVYWSIQLLARPLSLPAGAMPVTEQRGSQADLTRLFGAATAVAAAEPTLAAESRFQLLGVVAPRNPKASQAGEGVALISVDGVARTVRIGATVDGDLQLLAVDARSASLGSAGVVTMNLQLAAPAPASTGALPPATPSTTILGGNVPPVTPPMPPQQFQPPPQQPLQQQAVPQQQQQEIVDARGAPVR